MDAVAIADTFKCIPRRQKQILEVRDRVRCVVRGANAVLLANAVLPDALGGLLLFLLSYALLGTRLLRAV